MAKVKTKKWRENVSKSLIDRKLSEEHKKHIKENHWSKKGYISWNTGLTKETDERVRKQSKFLKEIWNKPEKIQFAKDRMKKIREKIVFPTKDTKIEIKIQNFLKQLGIEFFTHQYMKIEHSYQCDIFIPSRNLIIEVDGCYWHGCKICNKKPHKNLEKQIEKDKLRTQQLLEKGYKVLRLWEHDINKMSLEDFKVCV